MFRQAKGVPVSSHIVAGGDMPVLIPQYLIDQAMKKSNKALADLVAFDEGPALVHPLYIDREVRSFRFGKFLLMSSVLACLIGFTGLQVAQSHAPAAVNEFPFASSIQTMSATELVQLVKTENRTVYWLDAKRGETYTNSSTANGVSHIFYRPASNSVSNLNQYDFNVDTYRDYSTYDGLPHPLLGVNGRTTTLASGATVTYNVVSPTQAVVQFPNHPEVVVINYPNVQSVPSVINDAQNLVPIQ